MKTLALVVGLVLLALGVACFVPGVASNGVVFGLFPYSAPLAIAFIVTGAVGIMMGLSRKRELVEPRTEGARDLRDFGL
ncbi:MAG: hypothetical protein ABIQ72_17135 [Usitatibacter sp.]